MELATIKPKRSMKLKPSELKRLRAFKENNNWWDVTKTLDIPRDTLHRIISIGSGAEKTILKIRQNLPK